MVAPPQPGDDSYPLYRRERDGVLRDLQEKAAVLAEGVNRIEGMSLNVPQGAMYAFIRFELPPERGVHPESMNPEERTAYEAKRDTDYCMSLLEETGICVIPGSGFGQRPGTLHFRTTFLPPRDEIEEMVKKLKAFHERYVRDLVEA
jgi:alanine transaminase